MMIAKRPAELQAFRIAPGDSNYFACLFDPLADGVSFTLVVEIFEPGGRTPPNTHAIAEEVFTFWPAPAARSPGEKPGMSGLAMPWCCVPEPSTSWKTLALASSIA
jgi:hypothetical protein